jgi:predicted SAM-dependent methyltransferase
MAPTQESVLRINIGCGLSGVPGWYNIDNSPTVLLSRLPFGRKLFRTPAWPKDVRRHDVRKGLPFGDESVSYIYSSHTFEHFTWAESLAITRECHRVLRRGGVLRVGVPNLRILIDDYLQDKSDRASHRLVERLQLSHTLQDCLHTGAHHSQMFDERSLLHLFVSAGFVQAEVRSFRLSTIPDIATIEPEERKFETLYVEATK